MFPICGLSLSLKVDVLVTLGLAGRVALLPLELSSFDDPC